MLFNIKNNNLILKIKISPNSSKNELGEFFIDHNNKEILKAFVTAIPEKGKANKELIKLLSKMFKVSKSSIEIIHGKLDRNKTISISLSSLTEEQIQFLKDSVLYRKK